MRDLVVTENVTLDGIMSPLGDWFSPDGSDQELLAVSRQQDAAADALVLGRVTYQEFAGYWPDLEGDSTGISEYLNGVEKYVVSAGFTGADWQHTTVLHGPAETEIAALKAAPGNDIVITGSTTLVHSLQASGLIDEYRVWVYPLVQGHGRRLFPEGTASSLTLVEARSFPSGVVLLRYRTG